MKWLKKTLNKLFFQNDMEEEYDEIEYEADWEEYTYEQKQPQPKFRFPLIPDEEVRPTKNESPYQPAEAIKHDNAKHDVHHDKNSLVYDVDVPRIHELLEMRIQNKKKASRPDYKSPRRRELNLRKDADREPVRKKTEKTTEHEQNQLPLNRKRFIPTNVPSPVYGFQKPRPIHDLLAKKQQENRERELDDQKGLPDASTEIASGFENRPRTLAVEEIDKQLEKVKEEVEQILHQTKESLSITLEEKGSDSRSVLVEDAGNPDGMSGILEEQEVRSALQDEAPIMLEPAANSTPFINIQKAKESAANAEIGGQSDGSQTDVAPIEMEDFPFSGEQGEKMRTEEIGKEQKGPMNVCEADEAERSEERLQAETIIFGEGANSEILLQESGEAPTKEYQPEEKQFPTSDEGQSNTTLFDGPVSNDDEWPLKKPEIDGHHPNSLKKESAERLNEKERRKDGPHSTDETKNEMKENGTKNRPIPFNVIMLKSDKEKLAKKGQSHLDFGKPEPQEKKIEYNRKNFESITGKKEFFENSTQVEKKDSRYEKPPLSFLTPPESSAEDREWMESQAQKLVETLSYFQVTAKVESIMQGPAVTQFEITVGQGTKVSKIRNLADDLKLALAAKDIRIQAPIPGKNTIGIEIPNRISRAVRLSEVVNSERFLQSESPMEAALGLDLTGEPVTIDLRKMPHGLIAGATGSGKSVCINSILVSLLLKAEPSELKLMLIDPKVVELAPYNHIPHLVSPVITDVKAATVALKWAVDEMERRYQLFAHAGVRDLPRYNKLVEQEGKGSLKLPYILIVIDELADLMMMAPQDVEESICRIAQKARACGIHLILATQRPSVDVITGLIKSNIPTRIAFSVSSQIDSRTILDCQGAERLLGRGDMLYLGNGMSDPIRLQGTFVTDEEIEKIVDHVKKQGEPDYLFEQEELLKKVEMIEEQDELFEDVCRFVYEQGAASTSLIQRKYHIGYNRAARLIEMLESYGFVSEQKGSKPREVYITEKDLMELFD
ncbi:DNA translocase FtsK [Ureibacillus terrenus]|uniref:DNA translocase FtsK n=1 Tax=Ureibacillus terrenus TaxID=118246 RepID=A0A540V094_9BACL|nr:DNA translocase FtsK [Ureibacillus terrenus]TQE90190.1 DNA translocase FtsK [Ureibacillus terrenus]